MKGKTALIVVVAVVATAASVFVGTMAITRSADGNRVAAASTGSTPGEIQSTGTEVVELVEELEAAVSTEAVTSQDRDPMVEHVARPQPRSTDSGEPAPPPRPRMPSYTVTAVIIDGDPTAFLSLGSDNLIVKVGSEIKGGRVTAIEEDGVTLEGPAGTKKYPY